MRTVSKRVAGLAVVVLYSTTSLAGCDSQSSPPPNAESPSLTGSEPAHRIDDLTLITEPKTADPGQMMGIVSGVLGINENGCFALGDYVLITAYEGSILTSGDGISVPGMGKIMVGDHVRGGGGYLERFKEPGAGACVTGDTKGFVALHATE